MGRKGVENESQQSRGGPPPPLSRTTDTRPRRPWRHRRRPAGAGPDGELLATARDDAKLIIDRDPDLKGDRGQKLRVLLYLFERDAAVKFLRSG